MKFFYEEKQKKTIKNIYNILYQLLKLRFDLIFFLEGVTNKNELIMLFLSVLFTTQRLVLQYEQACVVLLKKRTRKVMSSKKIYVKEVGGGPQFYSL